MSRTLAFAVVAALGNLLQGCDTATAAGAILYIKREFHLQNRPTVEGLVITMPLIGAALVTTCSGAIADWRGRRPMLILSSVFYLVSSLMMLWSPNVYVLLLARFVEGFGVGLAVTLVPLYISEISLPEIRGLLNTLPQFIGSSGMFISYCIVFGMSMRQAPSWRLMFGVLSIPSIVYFVLTVCFLPESPRWLVSKGRMGEAKKVLQMLSCRQKVSGEIALLVEGLGVGRGTSLEKYIIEPADGMDLYREREMIIMTYRPEQSVSWAARPVIGQSSSALVPQRGTTDNKCLALVDPLVTLFIDVHEKFPETGSLRSTFFPHLGSMFSVGGNQQRNEEEFDEESLAIEGDEYQSDAGGDSDDNLQSPLISRQTTSMEKDLLPHDHGSSSFGMRHGTFAPETEEQVEDLGIGGGWQLAWKWSEKDLQDGKKEVEFKRIYLHQEGAVGSLRGTTFSLPNCDPPADSGATKVTALVSEPALSFGEELVRHHPVGPAMIHPSDVAVKGSHWRDLRESGVKYALVVGVGIQLLQQFSGINGVLFYTPQILQHAGVGALLADLHLSSESATLLVSAITTLLMLPSVAVAMRLMDMAGRRSLLLCTIPVLIVALIIQVVGTLLNVGSPLQAILSIISIVLYICFFMMGFGPIPNILCSEIFPTRVRGLCMSICGVAFWIGNVIVTYTLPLMLNSAGLAGIFGIYAVVCLVSCVFVFLKVPETKGMPLEVITEFFALGKKQAKDT